MGNIVALEVKKHCCWCYHLCAFKTCHSINFRFASCSNTSRKEDPVLLFATNFQFYYLGHNVCDWSMLLLKSMGKVVSMHTRPQAALFSFP